MIHFVGAGPGAVDLITVRGQKLLETADQIIYAGSLVNPQLLACAKKVGVEIKVIPLSAIEEQVSAANIHENSVCSESGTDIESVVSIPINSPVDKYAAYLDEL